MQTLRNRNIQFRAKTLGDDIITTLLENRGLSEQEQKEFLHPNISQLHDTNLLPDIEAFTKRVLQAKESRERVIVFGDYDVDGISGTAELFLFLKDIGLQVSYRLPHREKDGYGFKVKFIDDVHEVGATLVITVDCGTKDIEASEYAQSLGIDMMVVDHHEVPENFADTKALALINPHRPDSTYPFANLSASGVAFKVILHICKELYGEEEGIQRAMQYIDIASLGTVADVMPLKDENRVIASVGLKQMVHSNIPALKKLVHERGNPNPDADIIGFFIGPLLNATGRIDSPYMGLQMLLSHESTVQQKIEQIRALNEERKTITKTYVAEAMSMVDADKPILFYQSRDIPHGVIGLVAGRLCEHFNKPVISLKNEWDKLVASCRSPKHVSIMEVLDHCSDLFVGYGGHRQAAGLTVLKENFSAFVQKAELYTGKILKWVDTRKILTVDGVISPELVTLPLHQELTKLQPYGSANPKPLFVIKDLEYSSIDYLGRTKEHIKIIPKWYPFEIVAFGFGEDFHKIRNTKQKISLVGELNKNVWNGRETLQFRAIDFIV